MFLWYFSVLHPKRATSERCVSNKSCLTPWVLLLIQSKFRVEPLNEEACWCSTGLKRKTIKGRPTVGAHLFFLQQSLSSWISRSNEYATVFRRSYPLAQTHSVCSGQDEVKNPPQKLPPCEESRAPFQLGPGSLPPFQVSSAMHWGGRQWEWQPPGLGAASPTPFLMLDRVKSSASARNNWQKKKKKMWRFYWSFQSRLTGCKGLVSQTPSLILIMSFDGK